eukprot:gene12928-biopygen919
MSTKRVERAAPGAPVRALAHQCAPLAHQCAPLAHQCA